MPASALPSNVPARVSRLASLRHRWRNNPAPQLEMPAAVPYVARPKAARDPRPLGQILLDDGAVTPGNLLKAVVMRHRQSVPLGEILVAHGWVTEAALTRALSRQWRTTMPDLLSVPPDARLIDAAGAQFCINAGIVPWRRIGGITYVAASRPDEFEALRPRLAVALGEVRMMLCSPSLARDSVLQTRSTRLIREAETRVAGAFSCRTRSERLAGHLALAALAILVAGLFVAPLGVLTVLTLWAALTLVGTIVLKLLAFRATLRGQIVQTAPPPELKGPLPLISVMVPLFEEAHIADRLVGRLSRLTYPRELSDIILVVEETDKVTRAALDGVTLPRWLRVVIVPDGRIKTKPRALTYALSFCRGEIIGVWDAEDRPEPDQLYKVARHLHAAGPDVACVQGALDFYNPRTNWLSRCFTIEYAALFRGILPGVSRLGLIVPLGGTTQFFRREALERSGAWDAWNVTEDADLGVRLARMGMRVEVGDFTTHEEANCRTLPWIRQRSRWLKGYAMTWGVHMRRPALLWRQVGPAAFVAFQVQFLGMLTQYLLAPLLWSFWLLSLGLPHPLSAPLGSLWGGWGIPVLFTIFVASELLTMFIGAWAVRRTDHARLWAWVPTMHFYFPLGCLAAWKALYEVVANPFYWDKTAHGVFDGEADTPTEGSGTVLNASPPVSVAG
ncbi:glycosyltransferase family 2 protein [uncultured Paracoccus sp.]|uniref:glycosyltransferase family 2 protein n=1 Tax=uncultured Paracoccus sp. TaxID=189685 RepID=UPI002630C91A|nr:glycosyltransferase family 2 protein [uncultured Paracoccus sp.]